MGRAIEVPITPSVLKWAIDDSGFSHDEIADAVGVQPDTLGLWIHSKAKPSLTQVRKLAGKLHRPFASFLLPSPPKQQPLPVQFRHPLNSRSELNPEERRYLRRAARLQEIVAWVASELAVQPAKTPSSSIHDRPSLVALHVRQVLTVSEQDQKNWPSSSLAFDEWRSALENTGHIVLLLPLGKDSCRGFSLWNEYAPLIAINTAWNEEARIFTLFHELAHLITRTSSACIETFRSQAINDAVERWCERFAADVLVPTRDLERELRKIGWAPGQRIAAVETARQLARHYKVSLRAAVIRLIELDAADWTLYDKIPSISDVKKSGGGGGGRDRTQIREDQYGERVTSMFVSAVENELLSRSQALDYLDIPDTKFDELAHPSRRRA